MTTDSDSTDSLAISLFAFVVIIATFPLLVIEWAWATQIVWDWIAVTEFSLPPATRKGAYGIGVILGALSSRSMVSTAHFQAALNKHLRVPKATARDNLGRSAIGLIVPPLIVAHTWFALWVLS